MSDLFSAEVFAVSSHRDLHSSAFQSAGVLTEQGRKGADLIIELDPVGFETKLCLLSSYCYCFCVIYEQSWP